jgi:hypothetical protein
MNLKLLTAAAVLTTAIIAPAMAQDPAARAPSVGHQQDQVRVYHRNHGFWPGEVAAGVVGGAIGTAGAIATAPFRGDTQGKPSQAEPSTESSQAKSSDDPSGQASRH